MFRSIYRALVLSRTKSAAIQVANQLSHHTLNDIGASRHEIIHRSVEAVRKEFEKADLKRAQEAAANQNASNVFSDLIANSLLRPLGSARPYD